MIFRSKLKQPRRHWMAQTARLLGTMACATAFAVPATAATVELITNGDFEAGNTGFSSQHSYQTGPITAASTYAIDDSPNDVHPAFIPFGDHTSGTGLMMVVNGSTSGGTITWEQTVAVTAGLEYGFSASLASVYPTAPATLNLVINGTQLGNMNAPSTTGTWEQHAFTWNAGAATSAVIQLIETSTASGGNDYALDDISFLGETAMSAVPVPAAGIGLFSGLLALAGLRRRRQPTV